MLWKTVRVGGAAALIGWGGVSAVRFWKTSPLVRVKEIVFESDVPSALRRSFPIRASQNIFLMHPRHLEQEALQQFPELDFISMRRWFDRRVTVKGKFRVPVARTRVGNEVWGVDQQGTVFSLADVHSADPFLPWIESAFGSDRKMLVSCLSAWKSRVPDFYSLVKKIETDRMHKLSVDLTDDATIDWGDVEMEHINERARKILRLRLLFGPARKPAGVKFVTEDRIVMDANWKKLAK